MGLAPPLPISPARPSIEIDGARDATLTSSLMSMSIVESSAGLAHCELVLGNWGGPDHAGFQHFDRRTLDFGKRLAIALGDGHLFDGRLSAIGGVFPEGGPPQVKVDAEDRLQDLRMTRRTRSFAQATLADVLRQLANDHGLTPNLTLSGPRYPVLAQVNQSDLAFARDVARREDVQVWVDGTDLHALPRPQRRDASVSLAWAGSLREFSVAADLAHQRTGLAACGWDASAKRATRFVAEEATVSAELGGKPGGAATLQSAFGARVDTLAHGVPTDDAQAQALAETSFRYLARRFVVGRGVAQTQLALRVGAKVTIGGVGPLFEGDYTVTDTHIRFDQKLGLRTEFWCDRPAIGTP